MLRSAHGLAGRDMTEYDNYPYTHGFTYVIIIHELICCGARVNSQDADGNTPLHHAVFRGHERTVWAILSTSSPDLDIENNAGQTAMVMGYLTLWQRPEESAIRAVLTLAQVW